MDDKEVVGSRVEKKEKMEGKMGWVGELVEAEEMVYQIEELEEVELKVGQFEDLEEEEVRVAWIGDLEREVMVHCDEVIEQ